MSARLLLVVTLALVAAQGWGACRARTGREGQTVELSRAREDLPGIGRLERMLAAAFDTALSFERDLETNGPPIEKGVTNTLGPHAGQVVLARESRQTMRKMTIRNPASTDLTCLWAPEESAEPEEFTLRSEQSRLLQIPKAGGRLTIQNSGSEHAAFIIE